MSQRVHKRATTHTPRCSRHRLPPTSNIILSLVCLYYAAGTFEVASAKPAPASWFDLADFFTSPSSASAAAAHHLNLASSSPSGGRRSSHPDPAKRSIGGTHSLTSDRFTIVRRGGENDASAFRLRKRGGSNWSPQEASDDTSVNQQQPQQQAGVMLTSLGSALRLPPHYVYSTLLSHAKSSMKRSQAVRRSAQAMMVREKNGDSPSFRLRKRTSSHPPKERPKICYPIDDSLCFVPTS